MYQSFAYIYDALMDESYYKQWINFIEKHAEFKTVLDLGCGTGTNALALANKGYKVVGVDISLDMIEVAKIKDKENRIKWLHGDMKSFYGFGAFDLVICLCDSINYLSNKEDVLKFFKSVKKNMISGSTFIFDFHSMFKIDNDFFEYHQIDKDDDFILDWKVTKVGEGKISHELYFEDFLDPIRVKEQHIQQTYPVETYASLLQQAGFIDYSFYTDFGEYNKKGQRHLCVVRY